MKLELSNGPDVKHSSKGESSSTSEKVARYLHSKKVSVTEENNHPNIKFVKTSRTPKKSPELQTLEITVKQRVQRTQPQKRESPNKDKIKAMSLRN